MRTFGVAPDVSVPAFPLYQFPRHLGQTQTSPLQTAGAVGGKVAGQLVTDAMASSAAESGSTFMAAAAGPVGAAVAAGIAIVMSLLAAHEQRLRDAKTENSRVSTGVPSFYSTVQQIVAAYNAGQLASSDAVNALQQLDATTYQLFREFVGTPGTAWNTSQPGVCNKSCTVACCVYNTWLHPDLFGSGPKQGVIPVIEQGGGTLNIGGIPTNSYGLAPFSQITLTINPPGGTGVSGAMTSIDSALGGGSGLIWLALAAVAALVLFRGSSG